MKLWNRVRNFFRPAPRIVNKTRYVAPLNFYEAASIPQPDDDLLSFNQFLGDVNYDLPWFTRHRIISRSRYFESNSPIQARVTDIFEEFIIGSAGITIEPDSDNKRFNREAKKYFQNWCRAENCDIQGQHDFKALQGILARSWWTDGEVFIVLVIERGRRMIRIVETQDVCSYGVKDADVIDGIRYDKNRKPIGYYIKDPDGKGVTYYKAEYVIHLFTPIRPNQLRGIPYCYPVLKYLACFEKVVGYEQTHAKNMSKVSGFIRNKEGEEFTGLDALQESIEGGINHTEDAITETPDKDTEKKKLIEELKHTYGGDIADLGDYEFMELNTSRPNVNTMDFLKMLAGYICEGQGIGKLLFLGEGTQGTQVRANIEINKSFFHSHTHILAGALCQVYQFVMGSVPAGGVNGWNRCKYNIPRSIIVDIGRDSSKEIEEIKHGLKTLQDAYSERGLDWEAQLEQCAKETSFIKETAAKYGLKESDLLSKYLSLAENPYQNTQQKQTNKQQENK